MHHSSPARGALAVLVALLLCPSAPQAALPAYDELENVLVRNVRNGVVDYDGIRADPAFGRFVRGLGTAGPGDLGSDEQALAFYINAYNALVIQGILDGHSPASFWGRRRLFRRDDHQLLGNPISLHDLEQQKLADRGEPRVHFALVCAALSCPRLSPEAYRPDQLEAQLEAAARDFANDGTRNRYDVARKVAWLSPVYRENRATFEAAAGSVQKYLARYVADPAAAALLLQDGFRLEYTARDWALNGTDRSRSKQP